MVMKTVQIAQLKARLSEYLRGVRRGHELTVLERQTPIARIVPVDKGGLVLIPPKRPFAEIRDKRYPPARWAVSSTELLLEERQQR